MPRRISNEQIEKIRELQERGFRNSEIARMLNLPYSTVYYYLRKRYQKNKEYYTKYHKEYYQKNKEYLRLQRWIQTYKDSFIDMMNELNEFIDLTPNSRYTIFAGILRVLKDYKFGLDYRKIIRELTESEYGKKLRKIGNIRWVLNRLIEMDLVKRNSFGRYELTDRGRELIKQLFEV